MASYDRASRSWKTPQHSLDGGFTEYSETLPRSGWMANGTLFQLPPLVLLTYEIERGSSHGGAPIWPTPTAKDCDASGSRNTETSKAHAGTSLTDAVRGDGGTGRLWSTPTRRDSESLAKVTRGAGSKARGQERIEPLAVQVATEERRSWASPAARDYRSGRGRSPNGHTPQLPEQIGGNLNPDWVELLMGLPRGWTRLDGDQDGRTGYRAPSRRKRIASTVEPASPPSETHLSPISPKS